MNGLFALTDHDGEGVPAWLDSPWGATFAAVALAVGGRIFRRDDPENWEVVQTYDKEGRQQRPMTIEKDGRAQPPGHHNCGAWIALAPGVEALIAFVSACQKSGLVVWTNETELFLHPAALELGTDAAREFLRLVLVGGGWRNAAGQEKLRWELSSLVPPDGSAPAEWAIRRSGPWDVRLIADLSPDEFEMYWKASAFATRGDSAREITVPPPGANVIAAPGGFGIAPAA